MPASTSSRLDCLAARHTGFGLGLRTPHYADFLERKQPLDWLEIITDNYLVDGGKPLAVLDAIRRDYPVAMHGVAMSIGAANGVDIDYLRKVKALADRIEPLWVSDHLCWIGPGPEQLHDLYPLPYTDEAARHVITQIQRAQDVLGRRLVIENVSSYIDFQHSSASEWQFLSHIADAADCLLLVDVNNIYVSSVNHGFDPLDYLHALPAGRVQQIHLAGHSDQGDHIIDTHDHPVAQPVWDLYAAACRRFGNVATMIERDDHIPPLQDLLDEMQTARAVAAEHTPQYAVDLGVGVGATKSQQMPVAMPWHAAQTSSHSTEAAAVQDAVPVDLQAMQRRMADDVLAPSSPADAQAMSSDARVGGRFSVYHHAYRARLAEVLSDTFGKTWLYMGSDTFDTHARDYAVLQPPKVRNLNRYGERFPAFLRALYPANAELHELAQLDWDLRTRFDGADVAALAPDQVQGEAMAHWLQQAPVLHPSVLLRTVTRNVVPLWNAIDADEPVPEAAVLPTPATLMVWRLGQRPHFKTLDPAQAAFMQRLAEGLSIEQACAALAEADALPDASAVGQWLRALLDDGLALDMRMSVDAAADVPAARLPATDQFASAPA